MIPEGVQRDSSAITYALENLYRDQDFDWVVDTIPAVLAWVPATARERAPFVFGLSRSEGKPPGAVGSDSLSLTWNLGALEARDPTLRERARRMRAGRTAQREHVVELAGYGLALVAISALLPGERVVDMARYRAPDLLLDNTPGRLRGVEVAARSAGGVGALTGMRNDKIALILPRKDVLELHLSLWCGDPRMGLFARVKP